MCIYFYHARDAFTIAFGDGDVGQNHDSVMDYDTPSLPNSECANRQYFRTDALHEHRAALTP